MYKAGTAWRYVFIITASTLIGLPLFRYGFFNDLVMRASIPALFSLMILCAKYLIEAFNSKLKSTNLQAFSLVLVMLIFGSITPLLEVDSHIRSNQHEYNSWKSIGDLNIKPSDKPFIDQYIGKYDSFFYRHISQQ